MPPCRDGQYLLFLIHSLSSCLQPLPQKMFLMCENSSRMMVAFLFYLENLGLLLHLCLIGHFGNACQLTTHSVLRCSIFLTPRLALFLALPPTCCSSLSVSSRAFLSREAENTVNNSQITYKKRTLIHSLSNLSRKPAPCLQQPAQEASPLSDV